jgi:hypothetical protein
VNEKDTIVFALERCGGVIDSDDGEEISVEIDAVLLTFVYHSDGQIKDIRCWYP